MVSYSDIYLKSNNLFNHILQKNYLDFLAPSPTLTHTHTP